ncbi:acylphosphatase [Exiguobacterium sp. SL-10]|jgi:acylphosphatase|uniref:acylphosphatase n=1 Tax=Exiguobacterium sp. SL-10 TaxID=2510962 RepID=UPI00103C1817|nr:acylphosphatase [Exiguobacterium sp. SL-10]TCI28571.1 acylphosphatase [Exiguobacterium sp. SL-10]
MKQAQHLIVSGRVQGVGFRYFAQSTALEYGVTGWVRNLNDGTVELQIEGDAEKLTSYKRALYDGNRFVGVERIDAEDATVESYRKFDIRY